MSQPAPTVTQNGCTFTLTAAAPPAPGYRPTFQRVNADGSSTNLSCTQPGASPNPCTTTLPAGSYTFRVQWDGPSGSPSHISDTVDASCE